MGPLVNSISQAKHLQRTAGEHILVGTPAADATKALLRLGDAITAGSASGTYFGARMPTGFAGDLIRFEHADQGAPSICVRVFSGIAKIGFGTTPSSGSRRFNVNGDADDDTVASFGINNINTGAGAGVVYNLSSGAGGSIASGFLGCYNPNYTGVSAWADRLILATNANASGIVFEANSDVAQDMRFRVGTLGEQLRLSASGELLLGTTSSLGRLAVVGRADQVQCLIRGFSTQNSNVFAVQNSAAANLMSITNVGDLTIAGDVVATKGVIALGTAAGFNRIGGTASSATMLSVSTGLTGSVGISVRGIFAQTAALINLRQISSTLADRVTGVIDAPFVVLTDTSRTSRMVFSVVDFNATREFLRGECDGTNAMIGFLGAGAVVRQVVTGSRGGNAALASFLTGLATLGLITDSSTA